MFLEGIEAEANYEKSAAFFRCAINHGNSEAFQYLGRQFAGGLGMTRDQERAVEYCMNGAELENPGCLHEMGRCFYFGHGVEENERIMFEYCSNTANVGHVDEQRMVGWCPQMGVGTELNSVQAAK